MLSFRTYVEGMAPTDPVTIARIASEYKDQFQPGHPARVPVNSLRWIYDPKFPIEKIEDSREDWLAFLKSNEEAWALDGQPDRFKDMGDWWATSPKDDPLVIVEGVDKKFYVWDGNHRVALSYRLNHRTVPAYVGYQPD